MTSHLAWAEIDLAAFSHNIKELRRVTKPSAKLMAVIKANAYGHGAVELARQACKEAVDWLGVANINEGIELRQSGIKLPILIFGYTSGNLARTLLDYNLTPTVFSYEMATSFSDVLSGKDSLDIHIKVDTGMGRLGILTYDDHRKKEKAFAEIKSITSLKKICVKGIYTHLAAADTSDKSYSKTQLERFLSLLDQLNTSGISFEIAHAANSAAVIDLPETHLDMVRPGISLYGSYPSEAVDKSRVSLKPVMTVKTKIIQLKNVPKGFKVSYNMTYETKAPTTLATIPMGYADGYNRLLSSKGHMLINGIKAPVVGRVCMDLTMLDVGHIPDVAVEDEVVIFGEQTEEILAAEDLAKDLNTITYEIYTRIGDRVERVYLNG